MTATPLVYSSQKAGTALVGVRLVNIGVQTLRHAHRDGDHSHLTSDYGTDACGGMDIRQGETNDGKGALKCLDSPVEDYPKTIWSMEVCGAVRISAGDVGGRTMLG